MKPLTLILFTIGVLSAQVPNPTQNQKQQPLTPDSGQPIFRVTVVSRTIKAVNYHHRTGTTQIDFRGTELMPAARGEAHVSSQMGSTKIETSLNHMTSANQFGPEYITYVLWGITTEGRANNLGEVVLEGDHAKLLSTTDLQTFGLIVTAEPYFAVTQPSNVVVAENFIRNDTAGTIEQVDAKYELLQRGQYVLDRTNYQPVKVNAKGPLQLAEAENAVEIARLAGAEKYANDTYKKAVVSLQNAEGFLHGSRNRKESETDAREAAQMAEDARIITFRKIHDEQLANERAAAAAREAAAQQQAQQAQQQAAADNERRTKAEADRKAAEEAKAAADQARLQAEQATAQAQQERAAADTAKAAALAQQQAAQADAARAQQAAQLAEQQRQQAENDKTALRQRLLQQLNTILATRETQRGLIVDINDVLFDFNQYTLKPGAREKLAKVSGILLAYPGLKIQLEGHTDSVGSDDYNMKLSQQRADSVRTYVVSQGVPQDSVSATGLGKDDPVATNDTAAGRQQNRRVDMVVSGAPIGLGPLQ
ncbi:MAG TPA: OmpA family protein [Bryobacteraceae bacterium]|jgi:outer membrane protein OmpA-like peptidoglycan-associated protein|nr:OmpA family protein [Bryobacteraceae bacterium]